MSATTCLADCLRLTQGPLHTGLCQLEVFGSLEAFEATRLADAAECMHVLLGMLGMCLHLACA